MGLFKGKLKSALGKVFKRKPGGTVLGNLVRAGVNKVSGGLFGNGALMIKEGETADDANTRTAQIVGETSEALDNANNKYINTADQAATKSRLQRMLWPIVAVAVVVIGGLVALFKGKKGRR